MAFRPSTPRRSSGPLPWRAGALLLALAVLAAGVGMPKAWAAAPRTVVVIVNAERPATSLPRDFVAAAFLKKTTVWEDGSSLRPVDLRPEAAIRATFSQQILERPLEAVRIFWEQRIFSGRDIPPPELDTEQAVVQYVASHPGAIGYVSSGTPLTGVKAVEIR